MKIALFGATGNAGSHLLKALLAAGHEVSILVWDSKRPNLSNPTLRILEGDVLNLEDVRKTLEGQEMVISALNEGLTITRHTQSLGTANLIRVMQEKNIHRIICLGATGILQFDETELINQQPNYPVSNRKASAEHERVWKLLENSDLEWTMVCPPWIVDAPHDGRFMVKANYTPTQHPQINRVATARTSVVVPASLTTGGRPRV